MNVLWRKKKKKVNQRLQKKVQPVQTIDLRMLGVITMGVFFVVLLGAAWMKIMDPQTLPMRQVKLEAPFVHVSKETLHQLVKEKAVGGFFNVDVDAVTSAVTALPWVDSVAVRRLWPDTLHVTVHEQQPLARWQGQALVNLRGEVFAPEPDSFPVGLVELNGPPTTVGLVVNQFTEFSDLMKASSLRMAGLVLTSRRAWEVTLENSLVVDLGRKDASQRLQRFVEFYPYLVSQVENVKRVDMRYTNGFAVKWHSVPLA